MSGHHGHGGHTARSHGELGHQLPMNTYLTVFGLLLVLTVVTVTASQINFGPTWNPVISMLIASAKALLVALFFMHLKYENPITWLYAAFPIILLSLLIGLVFLDNPYRSDEGEGGAVDHQSTVAEHQGVADHH